jgi:signal transduction histidine kinase
VPSAPATQSSDTSIEALSELYLQALEDLRQRDALLAVAAHELRHPLHLMRLSLARWFPRGDERGRAVMERYVDRMTRVIGDMSDLIRIERDGLALQLSRVDITQVLRDIVDAYLPDATGRHVALTLDCATIPVWVHADEQRLAQVLSNVLDNALKFTPIGGSVMMSFSHAGEILQIRVRDTGDGISAEKLPQVFELFASGTPPRGMGIGLTVARKIMALHCGAITVTSDGIDRGTEVVISLPATALVSREIPSDTHFRLGEGAHVPARRRMHGNAPPA